MATYVNIAPRAIAVRELGVTILPRHRVVLSEELAKRPSYANCFTKIEESSSTGAIQDTIRASHKKVEVKAVEKTVETRPEVVPTTVKIEEGIPAEASFLFEETEETEEAGSIELTKTVKKSAKKKTTK